MSTTPLVRSAPRRRALGTLARVATRGVVWGTFLVVALLVALLLVVPKATGAVPLTVRTGSMEPTLGIGSIAVVRPVDTEELGVGDVVTFQARSGDPTLITHRIIAVTSRNGETSFRTQGDANDAPDREPVRAVQIRGEVWYDVPWVGRLIGELDGTDRQTLGRLLAAGLVVYAAGTVLVELVRRCRRQTVLGVLVLAAVAAAIALPRPASAATGLEISPDGRSWAAELSRPLFDSVSLVPGGAVRTALYARNATAAPARLQLSLADVTGDLPATVDVAVVHGDVTVDGAYVAAPAAQPLGRGTDVEPGGLRRIDVVLALPLTVGDDARRRTSSFVLSVSLGAAQLDLPVRPGSPPAGSPQPSAAPVGPAGPVTVTPGREPLPLTGGAPLAVALVATALLVVGAVLHGSARFSRPDNHSQRP